MKEVSAKASCGLEICSPVEIYTSLKYAAYLRYEFISVPLIHPRFKREFVAKCKNRVGPFTRADFSFSSSRCRSIILGKVMAHSDVECEFLIGASTFGLEQELNYGCHLCMSAVIVPLRSSNSVNLAKTVNTKLIESSSLNIWMEIPLVSKKKIASKWRSDLVEEEPVESTWEWWKKFHILCNFNIRLGILLEITSELPNEKELKRWEGEPIQCLVIPTEIFHMNQKGYPILSKPIRSFIKSLMPSNVQFIIRGNSKLDNLNQYRKYLNHFWQKTIEQKSQLEDRLSVRPKVPSEYEPLQGISLSQHIMRMLNENLAQYKQYKEAVHQVILDKTEGDKSKVLNIMIINPVKGVLIFSVLEMAVRCGRKIKIFAVENNKFNAMDLESYQADFWRDKVEVISKDISSVNLPPIIDVVITEAIGTFGDNELAPEILDKAQKFLKEGGVCIPESYNSYICPVQSTNAYSELKEAKNKKSIESPSGVVLITSYAPLSPKPLFSFHHPNYDEHVNNALYKSLSFEVELDCTFHGFIGFFDAVLYKDFKLNYLPDSGTEEAKEWNPIYFPFVSPVHLKAGQEIEIHFWRLVNEKKFWYEWTITKPIALRMHNSNGIYFSKPLKV